MIGKSEFVGALFSVSMAIALAAQGTENGWTYSTAGTAGTSSCAATAASPCGPSQWGKVSSTCTTGSNQSPIDITGAQSQTVYPLPTYYTPSTDGCYEWIQGTNGYGFQADFTNATHGCSYLYFTLQTEKYVLQKITFHTPSEHTIAGGAFSAEAQLHHKTASGKKIVLSVLLSEETGITGAGNAFLAPFWSLGGSALTTSTSMYAVSYQKPLNPYHSFLPGDVGRFVYDGSATTPDCSEGVKYYVYENPVKITSTDLSNLKAVAALGTFTQVDGYGNSNRPVQALNGRTVVYVPATAVSATDDYSTFEAQHNSIAGIVLAVIALGFLTVLGCVVVVVYSYVRLNRKAIDELKKAASPQSTPAADV